MIQIKAKTLLNLLLFDYYSSLLFQLAEMNTRIDKTMIFDRNSNEKAPPRTPETRDGIVEGNAGKLYNKFLTFGLSD